MAGSGKSHIINHLPLLFVDDGYTSCAMYRETNPMLEDGFWPNGREIWENMPDYMPDAVKPKILREQKKEIILNNGARIKYKQCADVKQAKKDAQGQEVTLYCLDEGTQLSWSFTEYLFSRLRSKSKHFSRIVISCNPDPDHEIREMIDWYLDEKGYPDPKKDGVRRFFYRLDGEYIWGNSMEELGDLTGMPEKEWEDNFFSFAFVSGTIYDNPVMMEANPSYLASLKALNPVDKAQLLYGNWNARPKGASYWERDWVINNKVDGLPEGCIKARAYDLAATERSQANKHPDPTACVGLARTKNGRYIMYGDYHEDTYDEMFNVYGQYCKRSGARDLQIAAQGHYDGRDTTIVLPQDPAAAGKTAFMEQAKFLMSEGLMVKKDPSHNNKSKMVKFLPFATACENGLVDIWWDSFDKKTREFIFKQMEAFDGERSTSTRKDEFPDCFATAFAHLCQKKIRGRFSGSGLSSGSSKLSAHKSRIQ